MTARPSELLAGIPPYLFAELERRTSELRAKGTEIIDLSVGDPDLPPPEEVLRVLSEAALNPQQHRYSSSRGEGFLRDAVSRWYDIRFGTTVDPANEVCITSGSKDGLSNILRAIANPDDVVLVPDPGYPVYGNGAARLARCRPVAMPLRADGCYLPDLQSWAGRGAKLAFLNYPNNPTGATASKAFLKEAVECALDEGLIICYDNAYSELSFDGVQPSILEIPGAMECAVEINSISKSFSMPGDRIGFVVGNPDVVANLAKLKSHVDSGCPVYVQTAAAHALSMYSSPRPPPAIARNIEIYRERTAIVTRGLREEGVKCAPAGATFYLWFDTGMDSMALTEDLLRSGILVAPGSVFGASSPSFIRLSLTKPAEDLERAIDVIGSCLGSKGA